MRSTCSGCWTNSAISTIAGAVRVALERLPPEISADLLDKGVLQTGGEALIKHMNERLSLDTGLPKLVDRDPPPSVAVGTGRMLEDFKLLSQLTRQI